MKIGRRQRRALLVFRRQRRAVSFSLLGVCGELFLLHRSAPAASCFCSSFGACGALFFMFRRLRRAISFFVDRKVVAPAAGSSFRICSAPAAGSSFVFVGRLRFAVFIFKMCGACGGLFFLKCSAPAAGSSFEILSAPAAGSSSYFWAPAAGSSSYFLTLGRAAFLNKTAALAAGSPFIFVGRLRRAAAFCKEQMQRPVEGPHPQPTPVRTPTGRER